MTTSPAFRSLLRAATSASILLLAGCVTAPPAPTRPPADTRSEIVRRMPAKVSDRDRWAADIETAFAAQRIEPTSENICAVLAITEQESGYVANPAVANLPKIARGEIDRRAAALHVPKFMVDAALAVRSPDGRSYAERLRADYPASSLVFEEMAREEREEV